MLLRSPVRWGDKFSQKAVQRFLPCVSIVSTL